ncbi:heavy-metal-associated domain-containing protein [Azotobacter vinelandii]
MGKKRKYKRQQAGPGPYGMGYGMGYGDVPPQAGGPRYGEDGAAGYGAYGYGGGPQQGFDGAYGGAYRQQAPGYGYGYGNGAPGGGFPGSGLFDAGLLQNMPAFLRSGNAEQFLLGALLGAAAAWVLADEELRGKLIKAGMKLYAGVAGGLRGDEGADGRHQGRGRRRAPRRGLMEGAWFVRLRPLHRTPGRVRYRYRCRAGTPLDAHSIEHEIATLKGVLQARANPAARSLVVEFEPGVVDPDGLAAAILALSPSGLPLSAANHRYSEAARLGGRWP